ncbi:hypothetical protein ACFVU3_16505 [Streptomyces sp. NPDC058052]|uniref:SCO2400 family protein n=1 Tax=Streptomyces sp. NPDC058052 TaxID=3346316 RepID=UPI0036E0B1EA
MDYCHACRRYLNGALACAGCGTPVERLRYDTPHALPHSAPHEGAEAPEPYPAGRPYEPEPYPVEAYPSDPYAAGPFATGAYGSASYAHPSSPQPSSPQPSSPQPSEPYSSEPYSSGAGAGLGAGDGAGVAEEEAPESGAPLAPEHVYELDLVVPPRSGGRAAGRSAPRRRKRGRAGRGRTVAVSALGLVLAAGSLGLAKAVFEEPEEKGPATAVEELEVTGTPLPPALPTRSPGEAAEEDGGEGDEAVEGSGGPATPTVRPRRISTGSGGGSGAGTAPASRTGTVSSGGPGTAAGQGSGTGTGTGSGSGGGGASARPSSAAPSSTAPSVPDVTAGPQGEEPGATPSASGSPTAPAPGGATPSASASATRPAPPTATPAPRPSETCTRFLWWCV